ncbi:class I SAM-dependent methyltransferase [uncultured Formosa sp.]|uniref:class I SAM-dependent methyltransferase n=1 Tax=uncultured Formosa sp. TaxID=255435 RepID=UPI0026031C34|nr:class I SAM-dependent methyltransferase [uncultured Formosa sp.]
MTRLITKDDIRDSLIKGQQRGWDFIFSKLISSNTSRTKTAFSKSAKISSNWWNIPEVKKRWNKKISDNENINYEEYLLNTILKNKKDLKLLSLGSGECYHEIELAHQDNFNKITCVDFTPIRISEAKKAAQKEKLKNIEFVCADIENYNIQKNYYDIVLFNASLHHLKNVESLLSKKINYCLKDAGLLIINEYVGPSRLQFTKFQLKKINEAIITIPKKFRKNFNSSIYKNNFSGPGIIRMIIADPSECIDSENIMPTIHKHFETIIEKPYGGNILMNVLKDISHHFIVLNDEKKEVLDKLFLLEDDYLIHNNSDFIFGVYKKL